MIRVGFTCIEDFLEEWYVIPITLIHVYYQYTRCFIISLLIQENPVMLLNPFNVNSF